MAEPGQRHCLLKGGRGGKGNYEFRSSRNQTPDFATSGAMGRELTLRMELKLLADIGWWACPTPASRPC